MGATVLVIGLSASAGAEPDCISALERVKAAHTVVVAHAIDFQTVGVDIAEATIARLKTAPGWWNSPGDYVDAISSISGPIIGQGTMLIDERLNVCRTEFKLVGAPADQVSPSREFKSRTAWVEPWKVGVQFEASSHQYQELTPSRAAEVRRKGRMPNGDSWGPSSYPTLVEHVVNNFRDASDLTCITDGSNILVSTEKFGVAAWIGANGELVAARLSLVGGMQARIEFTGTAAENVFPARYPKVMRTYLEREYSGVPVTPHRLVAIEVYGAPHPLAEVDRQFLDPITLGVTLIDQPRPESRGSAGLNSAVARLRTIPTTSIVVFAGVAMIGIALFLRWTKRRRNHRAATSKT